MVKLLFITPDYAKVIEYAARVSTHTECKDTPEEFVRRLVKKGHLSVGRHCMASFEVICSRCCQNQLVRHAHLSYLVESQRYVKFPIDKTSLDHYVVPQSVIDKGESPTYAQVITKIEEGYEQLLKAGISKEDARYLLPNACKTRLVISGNFQAWWDFIKLRCDKAAQWEIREIAETIRDVLVKEAPGFFDGL